MVCLQLADVEDVEGVLTQPEILAQKQTQEHQTYGLLLHDEIVHSIVYIL